MPGRLERQLWGKNSWLASEEWEKVTQSAKERIAVGRRACRSLEARSFGVFERRWVVSVPVCRVTGQSYAPHREGALGFGSTLERQTFHSFGDFSQNRCVWSSWSPHLFLKQSHVYWNLFQCRMVVGRVFMFLGKGTEREALMKAIQLVGKKQQTHLEICSWNCLICAEHYSLQLWNHFSQVLFFPVCLSVW